MKTIVIRPEIIAYHNSAFRDPKPPISKTLIASLALLPAVAVAGWLAGRTNATPPPAPVAAIHASLPAPAPAIAALPPVAAISADGAIELQSALDRKLVKADFSGNGRERLTAEISNPSAEPVKVRVSFGQMFISARNNVVATRNATAELAPGETTSLVIPCASTRSTNRVATGSYRLSPKTTPKIDLLLTHLQDHPEISQAALQTAILALTENLPLLAVCKFSPTGGDLPTRFDTSAFRVETIDILAALSVLRDIGVRDRDLAMTVDPQLKIEAMIDPVCRAIAMRHYGIGSGTEWAFWKSQLLEGDPGTRHYALWGIARFYPEIALEMLPQWAREKRTTPIFRLTAVQALGEIQRPEVLTILAGLSAELGRNTELGRTAFDTAQTLEASLRRSAESPRTVAFRGSVGAETF